MKTLIVLALLIPVNAEAKNYTFHYNTKDELKITITDAYDKDDAFKKAARLCFQILTKGKYPGNEIGLDIIDICANPKYNK